MKHTRNPASRSCNRGEELVSRARAAGAGEAAHLERERSAGGRVDAGLRDRRRREELRQPRCLARLRLGGGRVRGGGRALGASVGEDAGRLALVGDGGLAAHVLGLRGRRGSVAGRESKRCVCVHSRERSLAPASASRAPGGFRRRQRHGRCAAAAAPPATAAGSPCPFACRARASCGLVARLVRALVSIAVRKTTKRCSGGAAAALRCVCCLARGGAG